MARGFYVTDIGAEQIAKATVDGKVNIKKACFGDGGNEVEEWNYGITELKHQFYEKNLDPQTDSYSVNPEDPTEVLISTVLPNEVSGTINEIGYKDDQDHLIIYGVIRSRTKSSGDDGEIEQIQFNNWVKFENEQVGKVDIVIKSAEYEKVEQFLQKVEDEFDIKNYLKKDDAAKTYITEEKLGDIINQYVVTVEKMMGTKDSFDDIKGVESPQNGDVWIDKSTGKHYVYVGEGNGVDGSGWEELPGSAIDLSNYVTKDDLDSVDQKFDKQIKDVDQKFDEKLKGLDIDNLINMKFDTTQPQTPKKNMVWFDMTNKIIYVYNGSSWIPFGAVYL